MSRTYPLGLLFLAAFPLACSSPTSPAESIDAVSQAKQIPTSGPPIIVRPPPVTDEPPAPPPPPPRPVCSASTITWGASQAANTCAGGFEYHPYVAPCYAYRTNEPSCGSATLDKKLTCHWKFDCRRKEFGVAGSLPDVVVSTSFPATATTAGCLDWNSQQEMGWTYPNPNVNNGILWEAYTREASSAHYNPGANGNGTQFCQLTFSGVVKYRSFHEYNVSENYNFDEYYDNNCPEDPSQPFDCSTYTYPSCRNAQFGLDPDITACGVDTKLAYTAANISHATFTSGLKAGLPYAESCTSCEDVPMDAPGALTAASGAKAQNKAKCLIQRMGDVASSRAPATTFNATLNGKLAGELKLLTELEADLLTADQRDTAWKVALQTSDQESCEVSAWAPAAPLPAECAAPPAPGGGTTPFDLYMRRSFTECTNFAQPHSPVAAGMAMAPRCFALSSFIPKDASATCNYKAYRDEYRTVANSLIIKIVAALAIDPATESTDEIQTKLALIEQWYEGMRALYPAGSDRTALWGDISGVMGTFWHAALSRPFANVVVSNVNASNQFLNDSSTVVRKVLMAAFTNTASTTSPPLRSAPLLYLANDGFLTVVGRLDYVGLFHDMGCRFKGCAGGNVQTEVSQMWNALSLLADGPALGTGLPKMTMLKTPWASVFSAIQTSHAKTIEAAVMDAYGAATYSPVLLAGGDATTQPSPVNGLSQVIKKATTRSNNYRTAGLLSSNATDVIDIGLQDATVGTVPGTTNALTAELTKLEATLRTEITAYQSAQQSAVAAILGQLTSQQKDAQLASQTASQLAQWNHLGLEIAGLQASDANDDKGFGAFMTAYDDLNDGHLIDSSLMITRNTIRTSIPPSQAKGQGVWTDIRQIAVRTSTLPVPLPMNQGWMLNLTTTGKWTPTCALRWAAMPGNQTITGAENATTGPEGYMISSSSGTLSAVSNSTVDSRGAHASLDASVKLCAGIKGQAGLEFLGNGGGVYFDLQTCLSAEAGFSAAHTTSDTSSNGKEGRVTASFASGLHLPNTPFPEAPAGALLMVQMQAGKFTPDSIVDVRVVQSPDMSVLLDAPSATDVYFVDNDQGGCTYTRGDSLNLTITELESSRGVFADVGNAMSKALADIKSAGAGIAAQGTILPDDMAKLRGQAMTTLATTVPNVAQIPPALITLFNTFIDAQIVHIERTVEINIAEYQRSLITMALKQISDDVNANQGQARYYELLTALSMANLDSDWLTAAVNPLLELVTNELYNAAVIRYPAAIPAIQSAMSTELDKMTTLLDWTSVDVGLANQALHLVDGIEVQFDGTVHHTPPGQNVTQVVLAFRNPDFQLPVGASATPWPSADIESARAFWNAVNTGSVASVAISPESIYKDGAQGALPCNRFAPVIDDMALFIGEPSSTTSSIDTVTANGGLPGGFRVHDNQAFSEASGLVVYQFSDKTWLNGSSLYLIGGDAAFPQQIFTNTLNVHPANFSAAAGLSPFTTFEIDMAAVKAQVVAVGMTVPEIDLIMQVETKPLTAPLSWVRTCTTAATTPAASSTSGGSKSGTGTGTTPPITPPLATQ